MTKESGPTRLPPMSRDRTGNVFNVPPTVLKMLRVLLPVFIFLSAAGLALSLWVHTSAIFHLTTPIGGYAWALHFGLFLVCPPAAGAAMLAAVATRGGKPTELWKAARRGCPLWMRLMESGFFVYAFVNFFLFLNASHHRMESGAAPIAVFRGFSGHWMAFYCFALCEYYGAWRLQGRKRDRRQMSPNGISPSSETAERGHRRFDQTGSLDT